jgi:hypothetical protein
MAKHGSDVQSTNRTYNPKHAAASTTKRNGKPISFDVLIASMARDYRNI